MTPHPGFSGLVTPCLAASLVMAGLAHAITFTDDFSDGLDSLYWEIGTNQPLYTIDASGGEVHISKPVGGGYGFQYAEVAFRGGLQGDFDVTVDFRDAQIDRSDGWPGNQVQLNAHFGNQLFCIVRSDETNWGHNHHVWLNPPGSWFGTAADAATAGTMRIRRTGAHVAGYIDDSLIWEGDYNADPVTVIAFCLQNNGTNDATSIVFDNFTLLADAITAVDDASPPRRAELHPCFPNPFNPRTTVHFTLTVVDHVTLAIFDARGMEVARLVEESLPAGVHSVDWDGRDAYGASLPSGTYFCRLTTPKGVETRKLQLVR